MIRPLRNRHRVIVLGLAITLPAAFAAGIMTRRELPAAQGSTLDPLTDVRDRRPLWTRNDLWESAAIQTRLFSTSSDANRRAVELVISDRIVQPDLLVYWVPRESKIQNSLPDDAILVGTFEVATTIPLLLPEIVSKQTGQLILYSLADHVIIAVSKGFDAK